MGIYLVDHELGTCHLLAIYSVGVQNKNPINGALVGFFGGLVGCLSQKFTMLKANKSPPVGISGLLRLPCVHLAQWGHLCVYGVSKTILMAIWLGETILVSIWLSETIPVSIWLSETILVSVWLSDWDHPYVHLAQWDHPCVPLAQWDHLYNSVRWPLRLSHCHVCLDSAVQILSVRRNFVVRMSF